MEIFYWVVGILGAWFLIGCTVLSIIDDENESLFNWAKKCPILFGYEFTVMAWPVILWFKRSYCGK